MNHQWLALHTVKKEGKRKSKQLAELRREAIAFGVPERCLDDCALANRRLRERNPKRLRRCKQRLLLAYVLERTKLGPSLPYDIRQHIVEVDWRLSRGMISRRT